MKMIAKAPHTEGGEKLKDLQHVRPSSDEPLMVHAITS